MNIELLKQGLRALGLDDVDESVSKLIEYVEAIEAWNPAYGLVGASGDELLVKHILDSLAPVAIIRRLATESAVGGRPALVDVGTGAGLPGIPLALVLPEVDVTLLDRMTRRIRFLETMKAELVLDTVDIVEEQVEHAKGYFDVVTFRAFRPFERKLFKRVFSLCASGGSLVAYKGKMEKAEAELAEITGLYESAEVVPVKVPFLEDERCVVVMKPARRQ